MVCPPVAVSSHHMSSLIALSSHGLPSNCCILPWCVLPSCVIQLPCLSMVCPPIAVSSHHVSSNCHVLLWSVLQLLCPPIMCPPIAMSSYVLSSNCCVLLECVIQRGSVSSKVSSRRTCFQEKHALARVSAKEWLESRTSQLLWNSRATVGGGQWRTGTALQKLSQIVLQSVFKGSHIKKKTFFLGTETTRVYHAR